MIRHLFLLSALILPGSVLLAQGGSSLRTLKTRSISFQIDGKLPEVFAHSVDAEAGTAGVPVKVKSYLNHEDETLEMKGDKLIFTTSQDRSSLKEPDQILARIKVPASIRSAVLMFLPGSGKEGDPKYRILPVEDTTRSFPRGSFKVINLSPVPLRITLEKTLYDFKPGETKVIKDPPVNDRNSSAMRAFNRIDGEWRAIGATSWPHPGTKRVIHVAFYNPASKKVELRGIRDISVKDDPA